MTCLPTRNSYIGAQLTLPVWAKVPPGFCVCVVLVPGLWLGAMLSSVLPKFSPVFAKCMLLSIQSSFPKSDSGMDSEPKKFPNLERWALAALRCDLASGGLLGSV